MIVEFIDARRPKFGVEPICDVLVAQGVGIAPNTYYTVKKRGPLARASRDVELMVEIERVYDCNLSVNGADKIWTQLNRENITVARCTVERLMRQLGLSGKAFKVTTMSDEQLENRALSSQYPWS